MDRANKRHIKDVWTSFFRNSSAPAVWSQSEKKYIDKKEATCLLDEKRGVSLLSIHGKKYHHAITARSDLILGATSSRTQGASKGVGCMPQILGLSQIIENRWEEGRKVICVAIDLKKAFDTVNHKVLRATLRKKNVHGRLLHAVMGKYSCGKARIKRERAAWEAHVFKQ